MSSCNYCNRKFLLQRAKEQKLIITELNGTYYKHPKDVSIKKLSDKDREQYFAAWYMELPDSCRC